MGDLIRVLHIDDDPDFADLAATFLERAQTQITVETATHPHDGLQKFRDGAFDCIVSDYDMPDQNGVELLETIRDISTDIPFLLFTGKGSEAVASEAISAGVTEYLQKGNGTEQYTILANRITNAADHYRLEREAAHTRMQLRTILEHSEDAILTIAADGQIRFANQAVNDLLGYSPAELEGMPIVTILPDRYQDVSFAAVEQCVESNRSAGSGSEVEFTAQHKDGQTVPVLLQYSTFEQNGDRRFIGYLHEISDQPTTEAASPEQETRLQQLATHLDEVVWIADIVSDEILYVDPAYEDSWEQPSEMLSADPTVVLGDIHPDDWQRIEAALEQVPVGDFDEQYRIICPDGDIRWVRNRIISITDDAGNVSRLINMAADVTGRVEHTRQLETFSGNLPGIAYRCENRQAWPMEFIRGACESLTGYTASALENGDVAWGEDVIHPADQDRVWERVQAALETEDTFEVTYRIRAADGTTKWVWERGQAVQAPTWGNDSVEGFITDITDHKEREQELEEVNTLLATLIEALPVGVLAEDETRAVMAANQQLVELFEFSDSPSDLVGSDCDRMATTIRDQFASETFVDRIAEIISAREPVNNEELARPDGRTFERSYRPLDLPNGNGHLWVYRDLTDRIQQEQALQVLTQRLKALNRAMRELLAADTQEAVAEIGVRVATDILDLDASAIHLYDEDQDALVPIAASEMVYDLIGEPPTFTPGNGIAWRTYEQGEPVAFDDVQSDPDIHNPESPIQSELQVPIGTVGILMAGSPTPAAFDHEDLLLGELLAGTIATVLEQVDKTEQLQAREQELTTQNDRLEEFASVVSHDLRNPLTVASGKLELARAECESEHLDEIARAHTRMADLIDELLTLARTDDAPIEVTQLELPEFAETCWKNVETADATLAIEGTHTIRADVSRLKQVFENLIRNAVEHGGETVTVTVGDLPDGFYVEDTGLGIPPDERDDVFTSGYSTLPQGTGFGLSIVKQVVEAHGWTINLCEGPAGGARFEITGVGTVQR
ncbi:hybrid sensor histidine kinase/response regulator [Haloarcula amylovorans]|uniref:hybrid sensor histidine kinase/response regulator n=1 Tax=Haloarcula amylovorans TaxID=2562280 RepID=UPI001076BBDA|nr:PAS domain S-box protein [Halomicroarcula amylolytica]